MSVVVLNIKNEEKGKRLLDFLKTIEYVDVEEHSTRKVQKTKSKQKKEDDTSLLPELSDFCG